MKRTIKFILLILAIPVVLIGFVCGFIWHAFSSGVDLFENVWNGK